MHVNIWADMLRRNCTLPIRIACVTDTPEGIDPSIKIIKPPAEFHEVETVNWTMRGKPNCYRRLVMFRKDAAKFFGRRFCCMDLDTVIGGNVDAILSREEDFIINSPSFPSRRFRYNGSMMMLTAGARPQVYDEFTEGEALIASGQFVGSDQSWISYILGPGEAMFTADEGVVRWSEAPEGRIMFFPGKGFMKPWDLLGDPWVAKHYRRDGGRTGLVLGNRRTVWDEAKVAMKRRRFDHVVALVEAAERWPGKVDAVANDLVHAGALARMLGVDRPVVCGA
jgi:hypothetical protein